MVVVVVVVVVVVIGYRLVFAFTRVGRMSSGLLFVGTTRGHFLPFRKRKGIGEGLRRPLGHAEGH